MGQFVLNRNLTIRSLTGHSVAFQKGVPTYVPREMYREVISVGAERVDGDQAEGMSEPSAPPPEPTGAEREELVFEAFNEIVNKNAREDFTAQGAPHVKAIRTLVGFAVDNKERDTLWAKYRIAKAEES